MSAVLELIPLALTLLAGVGYSLAWYRLDRRGRRWPAGYRSEAGRAGHRGRRARHLAKLMYAWMLPAGGGPVAERQAGPELMYYGGTAIDVALAVIVMTQGCLAAGRARARRRVAAPAETFAATGREHAGRT